MKINASQAIVIGAIVCALAVAVGAFGAHGLKAILLENNRLETFETAVRYHFYHGLGLLIVGIIAQNFPSKNFSSVVLSFVGGIIIFSGSLYILSLTNILWLGAITPIGGVLFIAGWLTLSVKILR